MLTKDERNKSKWQNVKYAAKQQLSVTPEVFHSARRTGHFIRIFSVSPLWKTVRWWKRHCAPSASAPWRKVQNSIRFIWQSKNGRVEFFLTKNSALLFSVIKTPFAERGIESLLQMEKPLRFRFYCNEKPGNSYEWFPGLFSSIILSVVFYADFFILRNSSTYWGKSGA